LQSGGLFCFMKKPLRFFQFINLLSIDVAAGAMVSGLFFATIFEVQILPSGLAALGLTVWIIYTTDHLLDAHRLREPASTERHRFHQHFFKQLAFIVVAAVLIDIVLIFLIRKPILISGLVLAMIVAIYLLVQRNLKSLKELSATLLYCSGVALPALSLINYSPTPYQAILMIQFGITVLCNLLLFSLLDHSEDIRDRNSSFVTVMGAHKTRLLLFVLFAINGGLAILQMTYFSCPMGVTTVVFSMNVILFTIFIFPGFFAAQGLYRVFGDAVFLLPLFVLLT
jgi:hypothetical protein